MVAVPDLPRRVCQCEPFVVVGANGGTYQARVAVGHDRVGQGLITLENLDARDLGVIAGRGVGGEVGARVVLERNLVEHALFRRWQSRGAALVLGGQGRHGIDHLLAGRVGDRAEDGEAAVLVVQIARVISQVEEELAGGAIRVGTLFGHGDGAERV